MAEKEGGATKAAPPPRLSLPPRQSGENIFRGGGANSGISPGPMTLVSSFFADEPESDCRSFLQLLAGAMGSPAAVSGGAPAAMPQAKIAEISSDAEEMEEKIAVDGDARLTRSLFVLPQISSPNCLLDSPTFFVPCQGTFGISHQQALAQVTAQALQAAQSQLPADPPPLAITAAGEGPAAPPESSHSTADGYNWRKYGQKKVKCSEFPRSYYKCTYPNCQVKKKVEKSLDGQVVEITYKGQHIHSPHCSAKRSKSGGAAISPPQESSTSKNDHFGGDNHLMIDDEVEGKSPAGQTVEQLSGLSDVEDMDEAEVKTEKDMQQDLKKRKMETKAGGSTNKEPVPVEPKIIVQTTSEVDLLDDGYRWRKYGQKVVKGNPNPRSYYKCTSPGCNARKHIERASTDIKVVITTYERKHNHGVPGARPGNHTLLISDASTASTAVDM